jgi:hypothetical protein
MEKVREKLPEPSLPSCSSSWGCHGGEEKDPATKTGEIVPGLSYAMVMVTVTVEDDMVVRGEDRISRRLLSVRED